MTNQPHFRILIGGTPVGKTRDVDHAIAIAECERHKARSHNRDAAGMMIDTSELDQEPRDTSIRITIRRWGYPSVDIGGILGPDAHAVDPERWAHSVRMGAMFYDHVVGSLLPLNLTRRARMQSTIESMEPDRLREAFIGRGII
jgi:hypothetical protein